ncbi:orc1/cdc6 family replication initiation protein [Haloarchaeobius iranensis]|uniref:ORC1-type DNA replication protein n=1 Tax=Haloarchaeobius iranensis TaxID=996166 RepID=A0A1H0B413_9EURY|nr:orc1/cdc6 family replication initiation protein [Haloarchaeobius iranensis]SDN40369.1 ORC complex protein Cdc6/Orc1 [Haloarchaeobius iranensis]
MGLFEPDTDIYRDRDALREDYQPTEIIGRDDELNRYISALQPVINGDQPNNIFLYGKAGVGKSACTRYLLDELKQDATRHDVTLSTIFTNCEDLNTSYQVSVELVNELRPPDDQINTTGYPQHRVNEMLWEELDSLGGTVIIVLDEVDHLRNDSILYQIPRARANGNLDDAKVGIIGISNDFKFRDTLSSKVQSSLCEKELQFPAYDAEELRAILRQRADTAFYDDVVSQDVLALCAAFGAQDAGDARQSLDLLMEAGDLAAEENVEELTEYHVREARSRMEESRVKDGIIGLTDQGKLVLYALLMTEQAGKTPTRARELQARYELVCDRYGVSPLVPRRMRDHLNELAMLGIANSNERNEGEAGGRYYEYELATDRELLLDALSDTVDNVGDPERLKQQFQRS